MSIHHDPYASRIQPPQPPEDEGVVERAVTWITDGVTKAAIRFVDPGLPRAQEVSHKLTDLASGDPACGDMIDLALERLIEWGQLEAAKEPSSFTPVAKKIAIYTSDEGTKAGVAQFLKVFIGELILHLGEEVAGEGNSFPDAPSLMNAVTGRILDRVFSELDHLKKGEEDEAAGRIVDDLFRMVFEKAGVNWLVAYAGKHRVKPVLKMMLSGRLADYFRSLREIQDLSKQFRLNDHFDEFEPTFQTIHREIQKEIDRTLFYLPGQIEVLLGKDASEERVHFLSDFAASLARTQYRERQSLISDLTSVVLGSLFDPARPVQGEARSLTQEILPFVLGEVAASKETAAEFLEQFAITNESNEYRFQQLLVQNVLEQRKQKLVEKGEDSSRTALALVDRQIESLKTRLPQEKLCALLRPLEGLDEVDWSGRVVSVMREDDFLERRRRLRDLGMNILMAPAAERLLKKVFEEKFQEAMSDELYQTASRAILGGGLQFVARHLANVSFDYNIATNEYFLEAEVARLNLTGMGAHDIVLKPMEEVLNILFSKVEGLQFGNPIVDGILDACVKDQAIGNPAPFLKNVSTVFVARTLERAEGGSFWDKLDSISSHISSEIENAAEVMSWIHQQPPAIKKTWFDEQRKSDYAFFLYSNHLDMHGEALHDAMVDYAAARELSAAILSVFASQEDLNEILPMSFAEFPVHEMILNQMAWQLAPYMRDIADMAEAGMTFAVKVEEARDYLIGLEGEEFKILNSLNILIQQASTRFSAGESPASRFVKALANESLIEKPAIDMATVCVARAIRLGEGETPGEKMASLLEKLEEPVIGAVQDFRLYQAGSVESKKQDYLEAIGNPRIKEAADTFKDEGEPLYDRVIQFALAREMSEKITRLFIDPTSLSERDRPIYELIVDQLTYHIHPYFLEMQNYGDVHDLLFQLNDENRLSDAKAAIDAMGAGDLKELMKSMLGEGLTLSKEQMITGDQVVDDLIAAAFESEWRGMTAGWLLENASILMTAQALKLSEGETLEEKMASVSSRLSRTIEEAFTGYKAGQNQEKALQDMAEGMFRIFIPEDEMNRPLNRYLLDQVVVNLAPTAEFLFNYYEYLRMQEPAEGEPSGIERIVMDLAFVGIKETAGNSETRYPTTFEKAAVKSLMPELEKIKDQIESGEESALLDILKGGIRLFVKRVPNIYTDPGFLRRGLVKVISVAVDARSREPTTEEVNFYGDMDQFSEALSNRLLGIMFDETADPVIAEALKAQIKQQMTLLDSKNELIRNQFIKDQLEILVQKGGGKNKKKTVVPFLRSRRKKMTGEQKEIEKVKCEIAALTAEIVLEQAGQAAAERVPFSGFFAFVFSPVLSFLRAVLFFRLQWLVLKILDSTSGDKGQVMMCRMLWETVGLFDPQEKAADFEQERQGRLGRLLSELRNRPFELTSPFLNSSFLIGEDDTIAEILKRFHKNLHAQKTST